MHVESVTDGDPAVGSYLVCAQMLVDPAPGGLRATTSSGGVLSGSFGAHGESWTLRLPGSLVDAGAWPEIEDTLSLVLTTGWRRSGWVPLHAAGLTDGSRGVIVCATSGGGKTTFTLALVRRGWRSLGDDKLLLAMNGPRRVSGLTSFMNIDPAAATWFPELQAVAALPEYSAWTPKRRMPIGTLWPHGSALTMEPVVLLELERRGGRGGVAVTPLERPERIAALMRQTVIPSDRSLATSIIQAIVGCAEQATGYRVALYNDAYANPAYLDSLHELLA